MLYLNNHHFGRKAQLYQAVKPSVYNQLLNETACNFLLCDYKNEILQLDRAREFAQPFAPSHRLLTLSNKFSKWYMVSMIPMNTSRYKRDHSAGYETWIIHHGSCLPEATLFEI